MQKITIFEMFLEDYVAQMNKLAEDSKDFALAAQAVQSVLEVYYKEVYYKYKDDKPIPLEK